MKEYDMVIFVKAFTEGNITIPVGTVGCIVHVYGDGEAFEVEVATGPGESQVCTVELGSLMRHPNIKTREEALDEQEWLEIAKAVSKRRQHRTRW